MSDLSPHFRVQFANTQQLMLQQRGSVLRPFVTVSPLKGKAASPVDLFGATAAKKRTGKNAPKTPANTPVDRPWVYPQPYDWMDLIDSFDKLQTILDPQSMYSLNCNAALGRGVDIEIIDGIFGDAKRGEQGATTVTWAAFVAANAGHQIAVTVGGAGSGLNVAKLRAGKKALMKAQVDLQMDPITCAITAEQHDDLLGEVQVTSADFNGADRPVLKDGRIDRFLGINFVHYEGLGVDGSGYRRVPMWAKSGVHLGVFDEVESNVSVRSDLEGDPYQVSGSVTVGGTRSEDKKVVEILCAE